MDEDKKREEDDAFAKTMVFCACFAVVVAMWLYFATIKNPGNKEAFSALNAVTFIIIIGGGGLASLYLMRNVHFIKAGIYEQAIVFKKNVFYKILNAGNHLIYGHNLVYYTIDKRPIDTSYGFEIISQDNISLVYNIRIGYIISKPQNAYAENANPYNLIYNIILDSLQSIAETHSAINLLEQRHSIAQEIIESTKIQITEKGFEINKFSVTSVNLPYSIQEAYANQAIKQIKIEDSKTRVGF